MQASTWKKLAIASLVFGAGMAWLYFDEKGKLYGLADKKGITVADVDPEQLAIGIQVELEHTGDLATATEIALDHLAERDDYYIVHQKAGL